MTRAVPRTGAQAEAEARRVELRRRPLRQVATAVRTAALRAVTPDLKRREERGLTTQRDLERVDAALGTHHARRNR